MKMNVRLMSRLQNLRIVRQFSTKIKVTVQIEPAFEEALNSGDLKRQDSPGRMKQSVRELPHARLKAINTVLADHDMKSLVKESGTLVRKLKGRLPPGEKQDIIMKENLERRTVEDSRPDSFSDLDPKIAREVQKKEEQVITLRLKQLIHHWKPMDNSLHTCLQYLIARTPAEFVVLHKIFSEIAVRDPQFIPRTFFDFGSGVGSGFWAAREVWQKPFHEVFNVDCNVHMNDLAALLLCDGNKQKSLPAGIFFRQFLPVSPDPKYDIVLCAYSLLELPSMKHRVETLFTLWEKTNKYLVIVEQGTNAGYQMVLEARELIAKKMNKFDQRDSAKNNENTLHAHVFAPCPHDMSCPRYTRDYTPCNFKAQYNAPFVNLQKNPKSELYSYVVLKKEPRPHHDLQWPRCVRETLKRKRHVICTLCKPDGELSCVTISKAKHSRAAYACARVTAWGDLLPGSVFEKSADEGELSDDSAEDNLKCDENYEETNENVKFCDEEKNT